MTRDEATLEIVIYGEIPSINKLYNLHKPVSAKDSARIYVSKNGRKFKRVFKEIAEEAGLREIFDAHGLRGQLLELGVHFYFPQVFERSGIPVRIDADNPEKALFDALAAAIAVDDSFFFKHCTEKRKGERRTVVRIRPYLLGED